MDLSKEITNWDGDELTLAITAFVNWHNNRYYSNAICKFKKEDLAEWLRSLEPDRKSFNDAIVSLRYINYIIINWLKLKLVRSEGREFIALVGSVIDDEYWVICGERVDKIGLLTVLRDNRNETDFSFEHYKVEKATTFEGALRIAGFSVEDITSSVPVNHARRSGQRSINIEEDREIQRNRDVGE